MNRAPVIKKLTHRGPTVSKIANVLSFLQLTRNDAKVSDVKIDPGGGPNVTAEHFAPAGDDAHPLTSDYAIATETQRSGGAAVVGYLDPINTPKATPGDKRIYARDADTGAVVVDVWLKNDGTAVTANSNGSSTLNPDGSIVGTNSNGSFELQAGGDFVVNGVTIAANGDVTVPSSLNLNGKEIAEHDHPITWTDPAGSGTSGPNN